MLETSFSGVAVVAAVAFVVPVALGLDPRVRLPTAVLEILVGIAIGPHALGWVRMDPAIDVLSMVGLAFLLLLGGLEVDFERLRGKLLRTTGLGFMLSLGLALGVAATLAAIGLIQAPLLVAIILSATALGVIIPVLQDGGESASEFGQLVIAGASIADLATILLLTLFFSAEATSVGSKGALVASLFLLAGVLVLGVLRVERSMRLSAILVRLQDTSAQIRVRGAFFLLAGFVALAELLGLEVILGAFVAGAILRLVDRDEAMTHPLFRAKLEAIGFGVFAPIFFVATGLRFDLPAVVGSPSTIALVPLFLGALLVVRGLPALLYQPTLGTRGALAAGLLQATSLGFIVVATQIGMELGQLADAVGAALVGAGLLSVLIFPLAAATILGRQQTAVEGASPAAAKSH